MTATELQLLREAVKAALAANAWWPLTPARQRVVLNDIMKNIGGVVTTEGGGGGGPVEPL